MVMLGCDRPFHYLCSLGHGTGHSIGQRSGTRGVHFEQNLLFRGWSHDHCTRLEQDSLANPESNIVLQCHVGGHLDLLALGGYDHLILGRENHSSTFLVHGRAAHQNGLQSKGIEKNSDKKKTHMMMLFPNKS